MVFFSMFLYSMICGVWADSKGDPVIKKRNRKRVRAVLKMFFVTGLTWIAELISWGLHEAYEDPRRVYKAVFFFNLLNALQVKQP